MSWKKIVRAHRGVESDTFRATIIAVTTEDHIILVAITSSDDDDQEVDVLRVDVEVVSACVGPGNRERLKCTIKRRRCK